MLIAYYVHCLFHYDIYQFHLMVSSGLDDHGIC